MYPSLCWSISMSDSAYFRPGSLGRNSPQSSVFTGTWIRSGVSWLSGSQLRLQVPERPSIHVSWLTSASLNLKGFFPQSLTLIGGVSFITWCIRHPFLGEHWQGSRHFCNCWVCVGYGPMLCTHNDKGFAPSSSVHGVHDYYQHDCINVSELIGELCSWVYSLFSSSVYHVVLI